MKNKKGLIKQEDLNILIARGFDPDNLTVGGSLDLGGTGVTSLPDNLTVGRYLDLGGTGVTSLPDNLTVGGSLYLGGTGVTSLPDNLTVGGSLDLGGTGVTSLPDNLTVGRYLDLRGTGITSLPDNLTVGGSLYLQGTGITNTSNVKTDTYFLSWRDGKYILVDGEFTEVISKRGNAWKVKHLNKSKEFYVVTDGNGKYSHGDTLKEAKEDLIFKISNRDKSDFEHLTKNDVLTFEDAITFYRVVTGACAFGVKEFIKANNIKRKSYKISEIISLTENNYGHSNLLNFLK